MAQILSNEKTKILHDEALLSPNFISELNDYEIEKIIQYAASVISQKRFKAVDLVAKEDVIYPVKYTGGDEWKLWLKITGWDEIINKELRLINNLKKHVAKEMLHTHEKKNQSLDKKLVEQEQKYIDILGSDKPESISSDGNKQLIEIINLAIKPLQKKNKERAKEFMKLYATQKKKNPQYNPTDFVNEIDWVEPTPNTQKDWMEKFDKAEKTLSISN